MDSDIPTWFTEALDRQYEQCETIVDEVSISYRAWGRPNSKCIVLVHGGAAHSGWWDHIAPFVATDFRVLAVDLSGHGDSGHREKYSIEMWAQELMAVVRDEGGVRPLVFGHSMGGFVALKTAELYGDELGGILVIDSPVQETSPETKAWLAEGKKFPEHKVRGSRAELLSRFRTLPRDESSLEFIRNHIAAESVAEVDGGWVWKFDQGVFFHAGMEPEDLAAVDCPVALIRGERGMATTDITADVAERLGGHVPVTVIPDSGHHIMLDQPIALIAVLQMLAGLWALRTGAHV